MPTKSSERWIAGRRRRQGAARGARATRSTCSTPRTTSPPRSAQIEHMITKGAEALIIASIDGTTLTQPARRTPPTRTSRSSPTTASSATRRTSTTTRRSTTTRSACSRRTSLLNGLGLTDARRRARRGRPAGPFNIELFAGSPDDNNAHVLLQRRDGHAPAAHRRRHARREVGPDRLRAGRHLRWDGETAQERMENILTSTYSDGSQGQRACCRRTTACRAASSRR